MTESAPQWRSYPSQSQALGYVITGESQEDNRTLKRRRNLSPILFGGIISNPRGFFRNVFSRKDDFATRVISITNYQYEQGCARLLVALARRVNMNTRATGWRG